MACSKCNGNHATNKCNTSTPIVVPAAPAGEALCSGSMMMQCSPNQPPMPSPLPGEIPDTSVSTARIKACSNGHDVPPADSCAVSLGDMMVEVQKYLHCTLNAFEISKNQGSCGMLRVVNGAVEITGLSILIDECLSCLEPKKICPGLDGEVLTTVGTTVIWKKPTGGAAAAVNCAAIMPILEKDGGCIEAGSGLKYVLGYDAASDRVKYYPAPGGSSFIGSCADLRTKIQTECFTAKSGAPEKMFGTVGGVADWYPYSAPVAGAAAFIGDCAALKDKLGTCITEGASAPTKVLSKGANGIEWLNPPAGGGGGATTCAEMPALLKCPPDAAPAEEATRVLAYAADGSAKKFELIKPYHGEVRAAGDPPVGAAGGNAGGAKVQTMPTTFGTLNDIVGLWAGGTYNFSGDAATFDVGTGRYKILKTGRYQVSLGLFMRTVMTGGNVLLANGYAGITVKRPVTNYNGTAYRADSAIYRIGQQNFLGDGLAWDSSFQGSVTLALEAGSELWARAVIAKTSTAIVCSSFVVRDDPAAHFNLSQLPDSIMYMPGA